jgi:hypothetical protein
MATYAATTQVPVDRSRSEIERTLSRYGADAFMYGWDKDRAVVQFSAHDRIIRFMLPLPDKSDRRFRLTPTGKARTAESAEKEWEQACRQRWRALSLVIKAKLEAVEAGIAEFEDEFLAYIALPNGQTVSDFIRPQIDEAYITGLMPPMLPALGAGSP